MDEDKIRRFLESVNQGLEVSRRRLEAEADYLRRLSAHFAPLEREVERLRRGERHASLPPSPRGPSSR